MLLNILNRLHETNWLLHTRFLHWRQPQASANWTTTACCHNPVAQRIWEEVALICSTTTWVANPRPATRYWTRIGNTFHTNYAVRRLPNARVLASASGVCSRNWIRSVSRHTYLSLKRLRYTQTYERLYPSELFDKKPGLENVGGKKLTASPTHSEPFFGTTL